MVSRTATKKSSLAGQVALEQVYSDKYLSHGEENTCIKLGTLVQAKHCPQVLGTLLPLSFCVSGSHEQLSPDKSLSLEKKISALCYEHWFKQNPVPKYLADCFHFPFCFFPLCLLTMLFDNNPGP